MDLKDLLPVAILLGVTVIGIVLMAQINQKLYDTHTADTSLNGSAQNISGEGLNSMQELGQWTPTIALVIAAGIIISILIGAFAFGKK